MRIAIDIDNVLRDFTGALIEEYKKDFPDHKVGFINKWDLSQFFPIGKQIYDYAFKHKAESIFRYGKPCEGVAMFISELKAQGHEIWLITTQPHGKEFLTILWIYANIPVWDSIVYTKNKEVVNCDILLDDAPHNIKAFIKSGKRGIYFDQPWNVKMKGERVKSLEEFINLVEPKKGKKSIPTKKQIMKLIKKK